MANSFHSASPTPPRHDPKSMVFHTPMYVGMAEGGAEGGLHLLSDHRHVGLKVLCFHSPIGALRSRRGGLLRPSARATRGARSTSAHQLSEQESRESQMDECAMDECA